jgi:hypothetical protein
MGNDGDCMKGHDKANRVTHDLTQLSDRIRRSRIVQRACRGFHFVWELMGSGNVHPNIGRDGDGDSGRRESLVFDACEEISKKMSKESSKIMHACLTEQS